MKILCTGDIHIGRRSTLTDADAVDASCAGAWGRVVDYAVGQKVDALLLAGDIVDRDNRFFEAFGPLERGVRGLVENGVKVIAVAGNHDYDTLGSIQRSLGESSFVLLGAGGEWGTSLVEAGGRELEVLGWSFPASYYRDSPLKTLGPLPQAQTLRLGLLHADLSGPGDYAPAKPEELKRQDVRLWIVGHTHSPFLDLENRILAPGSPQAMDAGEPGPHGPWLLEFDERDKLRRAAHVPLSSVRYEKIEVNAKDLDFNACREAILEAVRDRRNVVRDQGGRPAEVLSCRLRLHGRSRLSARRQPDLAREVCDLQLGDDAMRLIVDRIDFETKPVVDLASLALANDPPGVLARLLLELESGKISQEALRLFRGMSEVLNGIEKSAKYFDVFSEESTHETVRRLALGEGMRLLDALLEQKAAQE